MKQIPKRFFSIDINCDLGEGKTVLDCTHDAKLMEYITRCNIACGGHAGNSEIILQTLKNATAHKLKIGAHPGYPDKQNFGRVVIPMDIESLLASIKQQLDLVIDIALKQQLQLDHVKLHGALYNEVEIQPELGRNLAEFLIRHYPDLNVLGLAGGNFQKMCQLLGLNFIAEGFIDRRYLDNGMLMPRSYPTAVITEPSDCANNAIKLVTQQQPNIETICLHGDTKNALSIVQTVTQALAQAKVRIE